MGKRGLALVIALTCALSLLVGCAGSDRASESRASSGLTPITIGADAYPPFSSNDENGNPVGIDVDIATEAFHRIGYEPTFTFIDWEKKADLLATGEIDCVMSCFSMTGRENE